MRKIFLVIGLFLITGCFSFLHSDNDIDLPEPGTKYNETSSPIGGGENYAQIIKKGDADHIVTTLEELHSVFQEVKEDEVIFIPEGVEIDLSKGGPLEVTVSNITIASNRGYKSSKGALLYTNGFDDRRMINIMGNSVRITGLRIEGPDKKVRKVRDDFPRVSGIYTNGFENLEVDNCEIFGWSFGGVVLRDAKDSYIHHNYIHRNRRTGLGYGIALYSYDTPTNVLVEGNYFTANRHSIAGSGQLGVSYEARYNYVRRNTSSHSFDMHGDHENPGSGSHFAGNEINIHHNTFFVKNQSIVIRGIPQQGASIHNNNFMRTKQDEAIRQKNYFGNMHVHNNRFKDDQNAWYVSWGGKEEWYSIKTSPSQFGMENTFIGDFNGDNVSDLLVWNRRAGYISYSKDSYYGHGPLKGIQLELHEHSNQHLLIGDFNGDSRDEILKVTGKKMYLGNPESEDWEPILTLHDEMDPNYIRVGDFNGDGKDDIFAFDGSNWFISYKLHGVWTKVKEQTVDPDQILIGNFSNTEQEDIIMVEGQQLFQHSLVTATLQTETANSRFNKTGPFKAGDFDGDGITDLISVENNNVNINYSSQNIWSKTKSLSHENIKVGDFNGDGVSDIIIYGKSLW